MSDERRIRVFLVDDVPELRLLVRLTLEEDPAIEVVGEASNGREGVERVAGTRPDVVLLDLSMPDMDGLEAIPLMRASAPDSCLVVLSGHEAGRVSLEALDQGATRYVNKSEDLATIREIVHEVARLDPPYTDDRFTIVRGMWEAFLGGRIDEMLRRAAADATWRPCAGKDRELRSRDEMRAYIKELVASGHFVDPRAHGVEPHGPGLVVLGTLAMVGPEGFSETEVFWAFCFRGDLVSLAAGHDRREEAIETLRTQCAG